MKKIAPYALASLLILNACQNVSNNELEDSNYATITGEAQGTTYKITYGGAKNHKFENAEFDSIFNSIDQSLSLWVSNSVINEFNEADTFKTSDSHFVKVYFRAQEIKELTSGAFEPMILPLVKYWGFGPQGAYQKDEAPLAPIIEMVGKEVQTKIDSMNFARGVEVMYIKDSGQKIDVNGIAQGYAVDVVCEFLDFKGVADYMVELGGEVRSKGKNASNSWWRVGVDKPVPLEEERGIELVIPLKNKSLVTSGSYRKYYEIDGKKYSHTIDPFTGHPVEHGLLSVSVLASNCTNADAFATAFMVMGVDRIKDFLNQHPELDLEVFLIFNTKSGVTETFMTKGLQTIAEKT